MPDLSNRVRRLEAPTAEHRAVFAWIEPGASKAAAQATIEKARKQSGRTEAVIAIGWKGATETSEQKK